MTQPAPPEPDPEQQDDDDVAELLLADAVAADDAAAEPEPDRGDQSQPDMGEPLTQPAQPPATAPAAPAPTQQPPTTSPTQPGLTITYPAANGSTGQPVAATVTVPPLVAPVPNGATQPPGPDVYDYPERTPLDQMTPQQQAEYWRHKARKHEDRVKAMGDYDDLKKVAGQYEALVQASQTEQERAVAEARRQGHAEALTAAGGQLVEQWMRAAAVGRLPQESVDAILAGLDRSRFIAQDGSVDTAKVWGFVNSIAPAVTPPAVQPGQPAPVAPAQQPAPAAPVTPTVTPAGGPDFGQGQPGNSRPAGIALGAEIARQRFAAQQKK